VKWFISPWSLNKSDKGRKHSGLLHLDKLKLSQSPLQQCQHALGLGQPDDGTGAKPRRAAANSQMVSQIGEHRPVTGLAIPLPDVCPSELTVQVT